MSLNAPLFRAVEEKIHGVRVSDPYRWLEDPGLPQTREWIEEQRQLCHAYFCSFDELASLRSRVADLLNVNVIDQPARLGSLCFYRRRNQDQEQACIYVQERTTGRERLLVDFSGQGPFTSVRIHRISDDASLLAFEVKRDGGDTKEIRIVDVGTERILPDKTGIGYARRFAFASCYDGFYYCQESVHGAPDHRILFHPIPGSTEDQVVFTRPRVPGDRLVLIADAINLGATWVKGRGPEAVCDFFIAPRVRDRNWRPVFVNKKLLHSPFLHLGRVFILSFEGADNGQIIELNLEGQKVRTVVPESKALPHQIAIAGGRLFVSYIDNGSTIIRSWTLEGERSATIDIPTDGTIQLLPQLATSGPNLFYTHESFVQPLRIFEYTTGIERSSRWEYCVPSLKQEDLEVRSLSYPGKDGTTIPITLVARNISQHTAERPTIMTSYGGFAVSITPRFSVLATIMMDLGAVFALPHIRGGGEFGKHWHFAGRARNRQTAIDDFLSAAGWLCSEGITGHSKLAIFGGSNSGLLVGAAMTQRPDLFRAVLCIAPLLDMVRYERFDQAFKWRQEYGTVDCADDFHALHAYSPYHHIDEISNYPATLFVTGDSDDRCNPAHVRKMAARLQGRAAQTNQILVDYSEERGHSPVLPLTVRIDALVRRIAFLCRELGIDASQEARREAMHS